MKKNSLMKALSAVAVSAVTLSAASMSAFAGDYTIKDGFDADASTAKPTLTIANYEAKAGDTVTVSVELNSNSAEAFFASTGMHFNFDSRLKLVPNEDAEVATLGSATSKLGYALVENGSGFVITTAGDRNKGKNGTFLTFDVTVPADAQPGDVYYLDVEAQDGDIFRMAGNDENDNALAETADSKNNEAYLFTKGIYNSTNTNPDPKLADHPEADGYIYIKEEEPETTTTTTAAPETTTTTTTTAAKPGTTTTAKPGTTTTAKPTTTKPTTTKPTTTAKPAGNSPKTGVAGVGVAVAGLAVAVGTAFVLRRKDEE